MGILNVTPDSFSDGGAFIAPEKALARARRMVAEGAAIIDVGGESTRPGAPPVGEQEELDRVIPVITAIAAELPVPVSVDTSKPRVMEEAAAAGAGLINDVLALRAPGALETAVRLQLPVCLMHMLGTPRTMQSAPHYHDVVAELLDFFDERIRTCEQAGLPRHRLLLDPGFGFGKTLEHNLMLLKHLSRFADTGLPLLVGISRKSMIGQLLDGAPVGERLYGSLAAAVLAVERGAAIVRVHDVAATADALRVVSALLEAG
ncbi:MAG TPA: dihydropteroate synthase [Sedimenticola thiotaurini]|uniref:Dihydropteroate synthase n=1 Tax=Sedimenticola thiotaurini TaxID=1543721 RepID=A0A831RLR7_9GAMM|nr:dihydropteroate synthase [Sedimenticola thiotaurini]